MIVCTTRRMAVVAALLGTLPAAPAQAQKVIEGFARSDQSDVSGVSVTSADMMALDDTRAHSFTCPVAWGIRTAANRIQSGATGPEAAGGGVGPMPDVVRDLLDGGAGPAAARLEQALTPAGNRDGATRHAARRLTRTLRGLLSGAGRMDPASPGTRTATQLHDAVVALNAFLAVSSPAFLRDQPRELRAVHEVLGRLVAAAWEHQGRGASASSASSASSAAAGRALACAPPPEVPSTPAPTPLQLCVTDGTRVLYVAALRDPRDGRVVVQSERGPVPVEEAYPGPRMRADEQPWFIEDRPLVLGADVYRKFGLPEERLPGTVTRVGEFEGVDVYTGSGVAELDVVYVPLGGCRFQRYRMQREISRVRG